jgi:hypothetical protein
MGPKDRPSTTPSLSNKPSHAEFGHIKGIDSSIQTTMAPSHPQMRRFATADAQVIHDNVMCTFKKKVMKKE